MKRNFNKIQRKILATISGNRCSICNNIFDNNFHADHVTPFSKGGKTVLKNGQALCAKCNLSKGTKL